MTERRETADLARRRLALDPMRSFIVQAPAGSGKTELLIQRYLVLLSCVDSPEEIAAITFTNKAAAEMRKRVLEALALARTLATCPGAGASREGARDPAPAQSYEMLTLEHARAALARDSARGWRLEHNAARLRIQTIDALCASLAGQMPVLAAFGGHAQVVEDAGSLYREAARSTLRLLQEKGEGAGAVARMIAHLENNMAVAEDLLVVMLRKRDQWRRYLPPEASSARDREVLEAGLETVRRGAVQKARSLYVDAVSPGARRGARSPRADDGGIPARDDVSGWQELAGQLLTRTGQWRKRSAPAQSLAARGDAVEELRLALHALPSLPEGRYTDAQWEALGAIARVLRLAAKRLESVFAERRTVDFVEIARGALDALGEADSPTDLLLALDYRIRHVLVDEFQDTSYTQFELLRRLTAGWERDDGRTLFVVGDPMQSIYRFREAEVGLFLRTPEHGIGVVKPQPIELSANFRSHAGIVEWVNRAFAQVMPKAADIAAGAVTYLASEPVREAQGDGVRVHAYFGEAAQDEAEAVAALVAAARREDPAGTVAILARNRNHLAQIVPELKRRGLRLRAVEIEPLAHRQVVQDLHALARVLVHPADRVAWLACLRAPWCGLTLADLHALCARDAGSTPVPRPPRAADAPEAGRNHAIPEEDGSSLTAAASPEREFDSRTVWELLHDDERLRGLSAEGRERILGDVARRRGVRDVLDDAMRERLRGTLRARVEGAWLALGGPACVEDETDLEDAQAYLDLLEDSEEAGDIADIDVFEEILGGLYALPDVHADESLQVMTIHKAKGLQFDTVIVPALGELSGRSERDLFAWLEQVAPQSSTVHPGPGHGAGTLLLAPINPSGGSDDPIYEFIRDFDKRRRSHEEGRLLYVAATRAKRRLHLLGATALDAVAEGDEAGATAAARPPRSGSLLAKLWPAVESVFQDAARTAQASGGPALGSGAQRGANPVDQRLRRLPRDWAFPEVPAAVVWEAPAQGARAHESIEFSWAGETARHVGSVVHRWLQRVAEDRLRGWNRARVEAMREALRRGLAIRGVEQGELEAAVDRAIHALIAAIEDPRGRWLLGPQPEARNEYRLRARADGKCRGLVIDRVFVDDQGTRWIVDYKTSSHEGSGLEDFLDRERERYAAQLEQYARALADGRQTRCGLYFPLVSGWREWRPAGLP